MSRSAWTFTLALCAAACGGGGDGVSSSKADTGNEGGGGQSGRPDATGTGGDVTPDARPEGGTVVPRDASTGGSGGATADAAPPGPDQGGGCPAGVENCACLPDDVCNAGFYCESGVCTACLPGLPDCPCGARGACGDGLTCVADVCRECSPDVAGCPCGPQNACGAGLICDADDDVCRPFLDCAAVTCAEHQVCRAEAGEDAGCLPECMPGYTWNAGTSSCDAQVGANCTPDAVGSIAAQCAGLSRLCLEVDDGAQCGACVDGTTDDAGALMACRPFDTCASLLCGGENRGCVNPPAGEDATCGDCLAGFVDRGGVCVSDVPPTCVPGQPGSIAPMCAAQNRACEPNGGAAQCGACLAGYHAVGAECVADAATCDPGSPLRTQCDDALRVCVDGAGGAACGDCVAGFVDVAGECLSLACDAVECGMAHRSCDGAPIGGCGPCLDGFDAADPNDPAGACLPHQTCGPNSCAAGQFCVEQGAGMPPLCNARPCPEGQALHENVVNGMVIGEGVCVECGLPCDGAGEVGLWPYAQDDNGQCLCQTAPGYFATGNDGGTQKCDADGDGYVNVTAATYFSPGADRHLRENARCEVQTIERVDLVNELGQTYALAVCDEGLHRPEQGPCASPGGIGLWEDESTDDPSAPFLTSVKNPEYPAGARRLHPEELNPLTRACAAGADVNANDILDVEEAQGTFAANYNAALRPFVEFGYFIELYTSSYTQNIPSGNACATDDDCGSDFCLGGRCGARRGVLTIRERSRCDADFPLGYRGPEAGDADAADGDPTDGYWRSCVRNRDASWDVDPAGNGNPVGVQQRAGLDFAQYNCGADRRAGTCSVPPPVALPPEGAFERPPVHGVCDTALADRAADLPWMGMGHHSQFKCTRAVDPIAPRDPRARPYEHPYNAFHALADDPGAPNVGGVTQPLTMHQCSLKPAVPGEAASVTCAAVSGREVERQDVGFASVRYVDTSADGVYTRGCIDEWKPAPVVSPRNEPADVDAWRDLCPGHRENPIGVLGAGNPGAFGHLSCGCTAHTGGAHCEIACGEALFVGDNAAVPGCDPVTGYCPFGTAATEGRVGLWMCGGVTTTSVAGDDPEAPPYLETITPEGTTWTLRQGEFPAAIRAEYMQENAGDPNSGWRLR